MPRIALALLVSLGLRLPVRAQWTDSAGEEHQLGKAGEAALLDGPEDQLRFTLARLDEVDRQGWTTLEELLRDVHERTGIPALAAAYVAAGKVVDEATVGVEAFGSEQPVGPGAPFHLGSVTKSITATLIGKLVEEGKLAWDTTVGDVLTDVEMHPAYRDVTLEELLQHRGGLHPFTDGPPPGFPELGPPKGSPVEARGAFLAATLRLPPAVEPGTTALYSNAGFTLAGALAERVTGTSWEELVTRLVFGPLGMSSAGFGVPEAPSGHAGYGPVFEPVPREAYPPVVRVAPAGDVHASVEDLARFALAHLKGLAGEDGILRTETVRRLHTLLAPESGFASGWLIGRLPSGEAVHRHGGTTGAYYAELQLVPERGSGIVFLTSVSQGLGEAVAGLVARALRQRLEPAVAGFQAEEGGGGIELVEADVAELDDARFWRVVDALSRALNDEDRAAYRALFAPDYPAGSRDSLFDFMARNVLPARGGIHSFHAPNPPFRADGSEQPMRVVTFHLENGFPGTFGIALDDEDRLVELSLFVKGDLCPNGTDRHCNRVTSRLGDER